MPICSCSCMIFLYVRYCIALCAWIRIIEHSSSHVCIFGSTCRCTSWNIRQFCPITTKILLTSSDDSNTHEDRRISNVHLCRHCTARWHSRHRYLSPVYLVSSCNFSNLPIEQAQTLTFGYITQRCDDMDHDPDPGILLPHLTLTEVSVGSTEGSYKFSIVMLTSAWLHVINNRHIGLILIFSK